MLQTRINCPFYYVQEADPSEKEAKIYVNDIQSLRTIYSNLHVTEQILVVKHAE